MRVAIVVSGSRGDVQPMLGLADALRLAGESVLVCSSPENAEWARSNGCTFEPIGESLRDNPSLGGWGLRAFSRFIRGQLEVQIRDLPRAVAGSDLVVASGLAFGVRPVAEHLRIPYRYISFVPAGFLGTTRDSMRTRLIRTAAGAFADLAYGVALNRARAGLGLPRVRNVMRQLMGPGTIAATDPALTVLRAGARLRYTQTGYPLLPERRELSDQLRRFLEQEPAPVYAGFGSMPTDNPGRLSKLVVDAAERAGQRLVVSRGWAGLPDPGRRDSCIFVDDEPHSRLFPRVAAVIHHGGAGTVATAARAGVPQVVLPQAADQFLWRDQVVALGLGPRAPMLRLTSASSLAKAISAAVTETAYRRRAIELAGQLSAAPDGAGATAAAITRFETELPT
jgi:vancomycin aglycone glucosyltransferase